MVNCFTRIARFHIISIHWMSNPELKGQEGAWNHKQDLEQLNHTLTSLRHCFERFPLVAPEEPEARAYFLLLDMVQDNTYIERNFHNLPPRVSQNPIFKIARQLYEAGLVAFRPQGPLRARDGDKQPERLSAQQDHMRFFNLVRSSETPYLLACLVELSYNRIRLATLNNITKSYHQKTGKLIEDWRLVDLQHVLCFDTPDETKSFCAKYNLFFRPLTDNTGEFLDMSQVPKGGIQRLEEEDPIVFSRTVVEPKRGGRSISSILADPYGTSSTKARAPSDSDSLFVPEELATAPNAPSSASPFGVPKASVQKTSAFGAPSPMPSVATPSESPFRKPSSPQLNPTANSFQPSNPFSSASLTTASAGPSSAFGRPSAFGQPSPARSSSAFGQPTPAVPTSAFGQPSPAVPPTSAFGQPSPVPSSSPFGQLSPAGSSSAFEKPSAFGQPTQILPTSAFGKPTPAAPSSAFGQPSQAAPSSAFGKPTPAFGQPSAAATTLKFGQPTPGLGQPSGTPTAPKFGQPSQSAISGSQPTNPPTPATTATPQPQRSLRDIGALDDLTSDAKQRRDADARPRLSGEELRARERAERASRLRPRSPPPQASKPASTVPAATSTTTPVPDKVTTPVPDSVTTPVPDSITTPVPGNITASVPQAGTVPAAVTSSSSIQSSDTARNVPLALSDEENAAANQAAYKFLKAWATTGPKPIGQPSEVFKTVWKFPFAIPAVESPAPAVDSPAPAVHSPAPAPVVEQQVSHPTPAPSRNAPPTVPPATHPDAAKKLRAVEKRKEEALQSLTSDLWDQGIPHDLKRAFVIDLIETKIFPKIKKQVDKEKEREKAGKSFFFVCSWEHY